MIRRLQRFSLLVMVIVCGLAAAYFLSRVGSSSAKAEPSPEYARMQGSLEKDLLVEIDKARKLEPLDSFTCDYSHDVPCWGDLVKRLRDGWLRSVPPHGDLERFTFDPSKLGVTSEDLEAFGRNQREYETGTKFSHLNDRVTGACKSSFDGSINCWYACSAHVRGCSGDGCRTETMLAESELADLKIMIETNHLASVIISNEKGMLSHVPINVDVVTQIGEHWRNQCSDVLIQMIMNYPETGFAFVTPNELRDALMHQVRSAPLALDIRDATRRAYVRRGRYLVRMLRRSREDGTITFPASKVKVDEIVDLKVESHSVDYPDFGLNPKELVALTGEYPEGTRNLKELLIKP